ncbi:hypothetical protein, partial [Phyllobacterium trifolii]|uniref:hypothetical protein n=1 Tax=Phyllobacterium trifolii TaxID=300193 RepID=UPI001AED4A89
GHSGSAAYDYGNLSTELGQFCILSTFNRVVAAREPHLDFQGDYPIPNRRIARILWWNRMPYAYKRGRSRYPTVDAKFV